DRDRTRPRLPDPPLTAQQTTSSPVVGELDSVPGRMSRADGAEYSRGVVGERERAPSGADEMVRLVPLFALAVAVLAVVVDRGSVIDFVLAAVPVVGFGVWAYVPGVPLPLVSVAVVVPVIAAQRSGHLESLMFELSLLAFVVGRWSKPLAAAVALGALT